MTLIELKIHNWSDISAKKEEWNEFMHNAANVSPLDLNKSRSTRQSFTVGLQLVTQKLLQQIPPSEVFFKSISASSLQKENHQLKVVFPQYDQGPSVSEVEKILMDAIKQGTQYHKKWLYRSCAGLPLTSLATIIPAPNLLFCWTGYRCYSHWHALQGAQALNSVLNYDGRVSYEENHKMGILVQDYLSSSLSDHRYNDSNIIHENFFQQMESYLQMDGIVLDAERHLNFVVNLQQSGRKS